MTTTAERTPPHTESMTRAYFLHGYATGYLAAMGAGPPKAVAVRRGWLARVFLRR